MIILVNLEEKVFYNETIEQKRLNETDANKKTVIFWGDAARDASVMIGFHKAVDQVKGALMVHNEQVVLPYYRELKQII